MRRPVGLLAITCITLLWSAALVAAPSADAPRVSAAIYAAGSLICHQLPERSFRHRGAQLPVCARCLGLYLGGAAGVVMWCAVAGLRDRPSRRVLRIVSPQVARRVLLFSALPTAITVLTASLGWWDANNTTRAVLAVPLGATIAALVAAVAAGDLR